jgi:excisionase family DNA binding protein
MSNVRKTKFSGISEQPVPIDVGDTNRLDGHAGDLPMSVATSSRISVQEIAADLAIGKHSVYRMLEGGVIPGIRLKRGWLVTRYAYERWKESCGTIRQAA